VQAVAGLNPASVQVVAGLTPSALAAVAGLGPNSVQAIAGLNPTSVQAVAGLNPSSLNAVAGLGTSSVAAVAGLNPSTLQAVAGLNPSALTAIAALGPKTIAIIAGIPAPTLIAISHLSPDTLKAIAGLDAATLKAISGLSQDALQALSTLATQAPALLKLLAGHVTVDSGNINARVGLLAHVDVQGDNNMVVQALSAGELGVVNTLISKLSSNPAALSLFVSKINFTGNNNFMSAGLLSKVNMGDGAANFEQRLDQDELSLLTTTLPAFTGNKQALAAALGLDVTLGNGNDMVSGSGLGRFQTGNGNNLFFIEDPSLMGVAASAVSGLFTALTGASAGLTFAGGFGTNTYYFVGQNLGAVTVDQKQTAAVDTLDLSAFTGSGGQSRLAEQERHGDRTEPVTHRLTRHLKRGRHPIRRHDPRQQSRQCACRRSAG